MEKKYIVRVGWVVGGILLLALVFNFTVDGWQWGPLDFVMMGGLLFVTGLALAWVLTSAITSSFRVLAALGVVLLFLAIWTELAVDAVSQLVAWLLS